MKDFIFVPGHAINPAAITHVKYNKDGSVHVMVGKDIITLHGDDAKPFFDAAPKPEPKPAAVPAKTPAPKSVE